MPFVSFLLTYLVTFLITELLRPKPDIENAKPSGIGDFTVPTATEGRVVPIIWGKVKLQGPNVVWYGDLTTTAITEKVKTGLFSSKRVTTGFKYFIGLQMALCRGPMNGPLDQLHHIRNDDNYAWGLQASTADAAINPTDSGAVGNINQPEFFGGEDAGGQGGLVGNFRIFAGSETQVISDYLTPFQSLQPAYRGTVYLVWEHGFVGLAPSLRPFHFEISRIPDGLNLTGLQPGDEIVDEGANPMNVIFEILENSEWGLNIPTTSINVVNFRALAATLATEGQGFAWIWDRVQDVLATIRILEEQIDGILFQDPITGIFDFVLIRDDYTPGTLPLLDETNVESITRFARPSWASTSNVVNLNFTSRNKNYSVSYALAQDMANIDINQAVNTVEIKMPGVKTPELANLIAWRELRQLSFPLATGSLIADRSQYDLKLGDVRELSWTILGLVRLPIRIIKVNRGQILDNKIKIDFTEDIFTAGTAAFADPTDSLWDPPSDAALAAFAEMLLEIPFAITDTGDGTHTIALQVGTIVVRDALAGMTSSYNIFATEADAPGPAPDPTQADVIPPGFGAAFSPYGLLNGALDRGETNGFQDAVGFQIDTVLDLDLVRNADAIELESLQNVLVIDNELILFSTVVDNLDGTFEIQDLIRGALDTLPATHVDDSAVWIFSYGIGLVNEVALQDGTRNFQVKNQTLTPFAEFPFGSIIAIALTTTGRAAFGYPPRDVQINPTAPGGGYFPVDAGSPSAAELVGTFAIRWHGSDKFTQAQATAWDAAHVTEENGVGFHLRIIEDPAGAATVKLDVSGIPAGVTEGAYNAQGFADETVTDQYQFELSSINAFGESQIWSVGPFAIYGMGYKFDEKFGGDTAGVILIKGDPPVQIVPVPGVSSETIFRITASGTFDADDDLHVRITFFELGASVGQDENYIIIGTSGGKTEIRDYLIELRDLIAIDFDPVKVSASVVGDVLTISSFFGSLGGSVQNNSAAARADLIEEATSILDGIAQVMHFDLFQADDSVSPAIESLAPDNASTYNSAVDRSNKLDLAVIGLTSEAKKVLPAGGTQRIRISWGGREISPGTQAINREIPLRDGTPALAGIPADSDLLSQLLELASSEWSEYIEAVRWSNYSPIPAASPPTFGNPQDRVGVEVTMKQNFALVSPEFWETAPDNTIYLGGFGPIRLLGKQLFKPQVFSKTGRRQTIRVSFSTEYQTNSAPISPVALGQIYTIDLDGTLFQETAIAADVTDGPYRDGIYGRLTTSINASGSFTVVATNTQPRETGLGTFITSIDIERDVVNTTFTFAARASHGLILAVESFNQ